jgi:hypothetical protein
MKTWRTSVIGWSAAAALGLCLTLSGNAAEEGEKVKLEIKTPKPAFVGTPKNLDPEILKQMEKPSTPQPTLMVPKGTKLLSAGKEVTSSDSAPIIGSLDLITDGDKEATDGSWVELGPGKQHVQIDLGEAANIAAIVVWHQHSDPRVYRDVVVQVSSDPNFINDVTTIYNNDLDNSSGLGIGKEKMYFENFKGRLIDGKGVKGRYVRLYSNGSTSDDQNHYTEVEVYGTPAA